MKKTIQIPFDGFYESIPAMIINDAIESAFRYNDHGDSNVPYQAKIDHKAMEEKYARQFVHLWNEWFFDETGIDLNAEFESISSPKEYNFTTDRLFIDVDSAALRAVYDKVINTPEFEKTVRERHSSCDGFISFYSNDPDEWRAKPYDELDHNESMTVIIAATNGEEFETPYDIELEAVMDSESWHFANLQYAAGRALDWEEITENPDYADAVQQCADAGARILTLDEFEDGAPVPYRCTKTMEMFK